MEATCLELQAEGLSINRLLFCLWLGETGLQLPDSCPLADQWQQQFSHPQRALRFELRKLKQQCPELDAVYQAMRKTELACEQVEIAQLYQCGQSARPKPPGHRLTVENLKRWLAQLDRMELWSTSALQRLLTFTAQSPELPHSAQQTDN